MKAKRKIFACLNCGADTGCPNKLVCDRCRTLKKQKKALTQGVQKVVEEKAQLQLTRHI